MRAVVFDGVEIPEALLAKEVQNHPSPSAAEARTAAGHALALRALLLNRALDLGLEAEPELDAEGCEETAEEALIRALLDREIDIAAPTEAECRRLYAAEPQRFLTPALYEASHILLEPQGEGETALSAARAMAIRLIDILETRARTFEELARDCSDCPSAGVGGSLGQLAPGDLIPEVEDVLEALQPGQVAPEPVLSRFGVHVLRLDRRIAGRQLPFEAVEGQIRLHLESRAWTAAATRYAAGLVAQARHDGVALTLTPDGAVRSGSATLGDFLDDGSAAERLAPWLEAVDPELLARLEAAAAAAGEPAEAFARSAMADFVAEADDERWTKLISAARDSEDPALACLATILRSKLSPSRRSFTVIRRAAP